jgi:hypothetical protein
LRIDVGLRGRRRVLLASCVAAAAAATMAVAGCSASGHPVPELKNGTFTGFPMPSAWAGGTYSKHYQAILGPKYGTGPKSFTIRAAADMVFWVGCVGTGDAVLRSPALGLDWHLPCSDYGDPAGLEFDPKTAVPAGKKVSVKLVTTVGTDRWDFRVDVQDGELAADVAS